MGSEARVFYSVESARLSGIQTTSRRSGDPFPNMGFCLDFGWPDSKFVKAMGVMGRLMFSSNLRDLCAQDPDRAVSLATRFITSHGTDVEAATALEEAALTALEEAALKAKSLEMSLKIYTRPELFAMKNKDRQQGEKDEDGDWYRGGWDAAGKRHGLGRWDWDDGEYEISECDHGRECGHWISYSKDGSIDCEGDV